MIFPPVKPQPATIFAALLLAIAFLYFLGALPANAELVPVEANTICNYFNPHDLDSQVGYNDYEYGSSSCTTTYLMYESTTTASSTFPAGYLNEVSSGTSSWFFVNAWTSADLLFAFLMIVFIILTIFFFFFNFNNEKTFRIKRNDDF